MTDHKHDKTCSHGHVLDLHGACCGGDTDFDANKRSTLDLLAKGGFAAHWLSADHGRNPASRRSR